MRVTVAYAPAPREVFEQIVELPDGASAADALLASQVPARFPALDWRALPAGVWSRVASWDQPLADGDRVELCRPLQVDPKVARRERFKRQGARGTGLFADRRAGGKPGYGG